MVRDGVYVTEEDVLMKLHGVYVAAVGRLHAVLEPTQSMKIDLDEAEMAEHSADYRLFPVPS